LERSDNATVRGHAFAVLKRGYTRRAVIVQESEMRAMDGVMHGLWLLLRRARPSVVKLDCGRWAEPMRRNRKAPLAPTLSAKYCACRETGRLTHQTYRNL